MKPIRSLTIPLALWTGIACLAAAPASASSIAGSFESVPQAAPAFDITALGDLDWVYWDTSASPATGVPTNEKSGGTAIGSMTAVGGGDPRGSSSATRPFSDFSYSDGTATVSGTATNPSGLFNSQLGAAGVGAGVSVGITLPTTNSYQVTVFGAVYRVASEFRASLPGAPDYTNTSLLRTTGSTSGAEKTSGAFTLIVTPDNPGDVLTVQLTGVTSYDNSAHAVISGVAVSEVIPPDPFLVHDTINGATDLNYGLVFSMTGETGTRVVRYVNEGATENISLDGISFTGAGAADFLITDIAVNGAGGQSPPVVLGPGDYADITVKAMPGVTGTGNTTATLQVTTDVPEQDQLLAASANVYGSGDLLNTNPRFLQVTTYTISSVPYAAAAEWSPRHVRVEPGLGAYSPAAIRVVGVGDPSGLPIGHADQASGIPNGCGDFESVFVFSPVAPGQFESYAGAAADGSFTDRTLQYLLLSDDNDARDGNLMTTGENVIINLSYLPDGVTTGGTPGFYVFDSVTGNWQLAIAVDLAGSSDLNNDGILNADDGDVLHTYQVSVKASGLGTVDAGYVVRVKSPTDPAAAVTLSSGTMAFWHGASGQTHTLASHSFTTADASDSNLSPGYQTPFWLDAAAIHAFEKPDPSLAIAEAPGLIFFDSDQTTTGTTSVTILNDGFDGDLTITALDLADPAFSLPTPPALPAVLPPGGVLTVDLVWDSSLAAPDNAALGELLITSDSPGTPHAVEISAGSYSESKLLPNWNFEAPSPTAGVDFLFWGEVVPQSTVPVAGIIPGSSRAVDVRGGRIDGATGLQASNFQVDIPFALTGPLAGSDRLFHMHLSTASGAGVQDDVNLRITSASVVQTYNGSAWVNVPNLDLSATPLAISVDADLNNSFNDPGDTLKVYWLRLTASGWGTPAADLAVQLFDSDGSTSLGASGAQTNLFREPADVQGFLLDGLGFVGLNGGRFVVDDVDARVVDAGEGVIITGVTGGPGGFTIHYDSGGAAVNIERSVGDLTSFEDIATGETSGTYTDTAAPAGKAFYRVYIP
ncbi:hypothetical protein [Luteolibacter marinus]|uniref:hypothetical protein n=1 Tax=Luteolibacter marinus TaxID=2776705 RepID=UPI001868C28D|nr:hypothetical protein [Luteolibacter marinus]